MSIRIYVFTSWRKVYFKFYKSETSFRQNCSYIEENLKYNITKKLLVWFRKVTSRYWMRPSSNTSTHFMATYLSVGVTKKQEGRKNVLILESRILAKTNKRLFSQLFFSRKKIILILIKSMKRTFCFLPKIASKTFWRYQTFFIICKEADRYDPTCLH